MNKQIISSDHSVDLQDLERMRLDMQQDVRRHYQSRTVAVTIPMYQALISGLLAGVLVAILLYALGVTSPKWILIGFLLTWVAVTSIVWWVRLRDWQALIWNMEQQMGIDLTGDQVIGPPMAIRAEVSRNGGANKTYADLQGTSLLDFLDGILAGESITEANWTPAKNGFSKSEYWKNVSALIRNGVLKWNNAQAHDQGVSLTPDGREILKQWIKEIEES